MIFKTLLQTELLFLHLKISSSGTKKIGAFEAQEEYLGSKAYTSFQIRIRSFTASISHTLLITD